MAFDLRGRGLSLDAACEDKISEGVELCPFLRNIGVNTTSFGFSKLKFPVPAPARAGRGPIFEDGPAFESSFRLFHGKDGVVPLKRASEGSGPVSETSDTKPSLSFHPLSASAATISLSSFGPAGPFGFDGFMEHFNAKKPNKKKPKKEPQPEKEHKSNLESHMHEAMGSDWLATGQCPIAKSFRAVSGVLPLVSNMLKLPKGMKYRCPPAIVAARAALAKTSAVKALRPQALPTKVLAIGMLGMALNVPLGVWREHTKKFSPQWFLAVHATIPFIAMLRKAVVMPKYAIAFTIGSAVLGQAVGARAERLRLAKLQASTVVQSQVSSLDSSPLELQSSTIVQSQVSSLDSPSSKLQSSVVQSQVSSLDSPSSKLQSSVVQPQVSSLDSPLLELQSSTVPVQMEQSQPSSEASPVAPSPQVMDQATIHITDVHSLPLVEELPTRRLASTSHVQDLMPSLLERSSPAIVHPKQQDSPFVEEHTSVDVAAQTGLQKRLTGLPNPNMQCGSEALVKRSMSSSSSQPVLVS